MATANTKICNMALGRLGALRINSFEDTDEDSTQAIQCRLHFEQTRDALLRSFSFRFARARATLEAHTDTPDFEWSLQYILPVDFLAMRSIYEGRYSRENVSSYDLEGKMLLSNDTTMEIRYTRKVEDASQFDPLFIEVLTLLLADKMVGPLAGGDARIQKKIDAALEKVMPAVRALDGQETNTEGIADLQTFNNARYHG